MHFLFLQKYKKRAKKQTLFKKKKKKKVFFYFTIIFFIFASRKYKYETNIFTKIVCNQRW